LRISVGFRVSVVPLFTSTVRPSGADRATASAPTTVAPPGRFSTTTFVPRAGAMRSASSRAITSVDPPGGKGTTSVTGRAGWAKAGAASPVASPISPRRRIAGAGMVVLPVFAGNLPRRAAGCYGLRPRAAINEGMP
jgi:hypothetical protein